MGRAVAAEFENTSWEVLSLCEPFWVSFCFMGALFIVSHGPGWARASDVAGAAGAARLAQLTIRLGLSALLFGLGTASLQPTRVFRAQGLGEVLLLGPLP